MSRGQADWFSWLRGVLPTMVMGQGADLFALPVDLIRGAAAFFECAVGRDRLIARHDDFWISAFLKLRHNVSSLRLRGPADEPVQDKRALRNATRRNVELRRAMVRGVRMGLVASTDAVRVAAACVKHYDYMRDVCAWAEGQRQ